MVLLHTLPFGTVEATLLTTHLFDHLGHEAKLRKAEPLLVVILVSHSILGKSRVSHLLLHFGVLHLQDGVC